jgi:hypothetical protein
VKGETFERERSRILGLADKWMGPLGLKWWRITFDWYERNKDYCRAYGYDSEDKFTLSVMTCTPDWRYRTANIGVNVVAIKGQEDDDVEKWLLHEFAHILIAEVVASHGDTDHAERVCQGLADAFLWIHRGCE